ncbi:MAG: hypothetical protein ACI9BD_000994 [Candidatus Marinamargulisbacteria bacterium]|jgi:hypothetical protein
MSRVTGGGSPQNPIPEKLAKVHDQLAGLERDLDVLGVRLPRGAEEFREADNLLDALATATKGKSQYGSQRRVVNQTEVHKATDRLFMRLEALTIFLEVPKMKNPQLVSNLPDVVKSLDACLGKLASARQNVSGQMADDLSVPTRATGAKHGGASGSRADNAGPVTVHDLIRVHHGENPAMQCQEYNATQAAPLIPHLATSEGRGLASTAMELAAHVDWNGVDVQATDSSDKPAYWHRMAALIESGTIPPGEKLTMNCADFTSLCQMRADRADSDIQDVVVLLKGDNATASQAKWGTWVPGFSSAEPIDLTEKKIPAGKAVFFMEGELNSGTFRNMTHTFVSLGATDDGTTLCTSSWNYPVKGVAAAVPLEQVLAHALVVDCQDSHSVADALGPEVYARVRALSDGRAPLQEVVQAVVAMKLDYSPVLKVQP